MNVHKSVGDLLAFVATAIREGKPVNPKLAKYALDILEGRFVPLAKGTNACATGFPEVCDVAFDFAGVPTWIARDKDGSAFAFRGFGPNGGPGNLIETPKRWHIELVHGIENDVPVVAWPKENPCVFDVRWNEQHRLIGEVGIRKNPPAFALWKDDEDRRFVAVFGPHDGQIVCLDDQSFDRRYDFGAHRCVTTVGASGGQAWIVVRVEEQETTFQVLDGQGKPIGTMPNGEFGILMNAGRASLVRTKTQTGWDARAGTFRTTDYRRHVVLNFHRAAIIVDNRDTVAVDALTGVRYDTGTLDMDGAVLAATDGELYVASHHDRLVIYDRTDGVVLRTWNVRQTYSFLQFGNSVCVPFRHATWHVFDEAHREWDTGIPSTDRIQLLHDGRAATWKFVDGTLYTRVVKSAD